MSKAKIKDYGTVDFDPMDYDNNVYDLYDVVILNNETDEIEGQEHYVREREWSIAVNSTYGRELFSEEERAGFCEAVYNGECYECEAIYHVAYVYDHDED